MKTYRLQSPFYFIFFSYVSGLLCGNICKEAFFIWLFLLLISGGTICYLLLKKSYRWTSGLICLCIAFFLGGGRMCFDNSVRYSDKLGISDKKECYYVKVVSEVLEKPKTFQLKVLVLSEWNDSSKTWFKHNEKALLYLEKSGSAKNLEVGDFLEISAKFQALKGGYANFMKKQHIKQSAYVSKNNWLKDTVSRENNLRRYAIRIRKEMSAFLQSKALSPKERGVAQALLLGDKSEMDVQLQQEFRNVGVVHVLCVSGMHLGVVAYVVTSILSPLKRRFLKTFIVCLILWSYALLTGLSPSVCRAACMFSFVSLGQSLGRSVPIYRSLALSAFLLLWIEPNLIFDIGFELSYLAVLGIAVLTPSTYPTWIEKRLWLKKTISLLLVSVAAQCATAPLSLYYFNQFPIYFMIANALISPLSGIVLPLGLIGCIARLFAGEFISEFIAYLLHWGLYCMNQIVGFIEAWPGAVQKLPLPLISCILAYALFCLLIYAWKSGNRYGLKAAFYCAIGIILLI